MSDLDNARMLLLMAEKDLRAIAGMDDAGTFADEVFGFHAQQAAEKALKAWISILGREYPLIHNLPSLLMLLERLGADVSAFRDIAAFNPFGVQFRYDAMDETEEPIDRQSAVLSVSYLVHHVTGMLDDALKQTG